MTRILLDVIVLFSLLCRTKSQGNFSISTTTLPVASTLSITDNGTHVDVTISTTVSPSTTKRPLSSSSVLLPPTRKDNGTHVGELSNISTTISPPITTITLLPTTTASLPFPTKESNGTEIPVNSPCRTFYRETSIAPENVEVAHFHMHQAFPLWYTYCSASLMPLMCSVYLPKYDPETVTKSQGPCPDLCDQVASDCSYAATKLNFPISTLLNKCYEGDTRNATNCFGLTTTEGLPVNRSCCFEIKPQPFCKNFQRERTALDNTMQDEIIFKLSTYLPLFHALDSLNLSYCANQLSSYLCVKHFRLCSRTEDVECPAKVIDASRQHCLTFMNISSPCSLSRINASLKNAGYNIEVPRTDFECSKLPSRNEDSFLIQNFIRLSFVQPSITNGGNIPRLSNFSVLRLSNSSSLDIHWKMNRERNNIKEYGILWRKRPENSVNETRAYQHIHTKTDHYTFNNMESNVQYEILVTAVLPNSVPEPFTLIVTPNNGFCQSETIGAPEAYGILQWPETLVRDRSEIPCPYNTESFASRDCRYSNQSLVWGPTDVTNCKYKEERSKDLFLLAQKEVNISNVVETNEEVKNLSVPGKTLKAGDIVNIATILENIVAVEEKANEVSEDFLTTIDNVLDARIENVLESQKTASSSSRTVRALNSLAENLVIYPKNKFEKVKRNYAINLHSVPSQNFSGLSFSGVVQSNPRKSEIKNNSIATNFNDSVPGDSSASISIPPTIFTESTIKNLSTPQTAIFVFYKETKFFRVSLDDTIKTSRRLNSVVIAGSIKGLPIENLSEPVKLAFQSIARGDTNSTLCSYWNFVLENWSQEGCTFQGVLGDGRIRCNCDHLTNFAMLMDIKPSVPTKHDRILGVISYVGCALSLIGLVLTIITILILRELRSKIPGQILLNFCIALSLSLIVFLSAAEKSKTSSLAGCRTAAIALHYFLLSTFFWMAIQAFNMYLAFVKVFPNSNPSKFILKCCLFAWGLPVPIVVVTMIVALDKYGDDTYCRLHGVPFIVAFFTPVTVIIVGNIVAFSFIIRSLVTSGNKVTSVGKASGYLQARQGIAIMVLLGLTWLFGILAINDAKIAFQYLFCIFNTLQGLFVFIFFCILPVATRRQLLSLFRKKTHGPRQKSELQNSNGRNMALNNLPYSSDTSPTQNNSTELRFQSLLSDNPVQEAPFKNSREKENHPSEEVNPPSGKENLQNVTLNPKISDVIFLNPNVTRYSVRKNGLNYVTTIEINLQTRDDP